MSRLGRGVLVFIDGSGNYVANMGVPGGNNFLVNGTAPTVSNGMVEAYYLGAVNGAQGNATFMTYDNTYGFKPVTYMLTSFAGANDSKTVKLTSATTVSTPTQAYALSLVNPVGTLTLNSTLTLGNGTQPAGLLMSIGGVTAITGSGTLAFGNSEGIIYLGSSSGTISVPITGNQGFTRVAYNGSSQAQLILAADSPNLTGAVTVNNGQLQIGNNGTAGSFGAGLTLLGTSQLNYNRTDNASPIGGALTSAGGIISVNSGTLTLNAANLPSGSGPAFTLAGASGATLALNGAASSLATISGNGAVGERVQVLSGTVSINTGANLALNFLVDGGILTQPATVDRFQLAVSNQTFTVQAGTVTLPASRYGLRIGSANGAGYGGAANVTGLQSGGSVNCSLMEMGATDTSATKSPTYTLSGGTLSVLNGGALKIGADTTGAGTTAFHLSGTGKLSVSGTLAGTQGAGARQVFNFAGGTLVAALVDATKLSTAPAPTTQGVLVNNGGMLAPGDIGTAGKTAITGSYSNAPASTLALDIGGTVPGADFQTGQYDTVSVSGNVHLDGGLCVNLVNGYLPGAANTFDILTYAGTVLSGTFSNLTAGKVFASDGYSAFDVVVNTSAKKVTLANRLANEWAPASGAHWTNSAAWSLAQPNGSGYVAFFGANLALSGTVTLDAARTVRGLIFTNGVASYTIAGTGTLTLGDALSASRVSVSAGSHTVSVPLTLITATTFAVDGLSNVFTLSGTVTGNQDVIKTGTGTFVLCGLTNTVGDFWIQAGAVRQTAGFTQADILTVESGALFELAGGSMTCNGLSLTGAFNFTRGAAGKMYIKKGLAEGAVDTVSEVKTAIDEGFITYGCERVPAAEFLVTETTINAVVYVKVEKRSSATMVILQ